MEQATRELIEEFVTNLVITYGSSDPDGRITPEDEAAIDKVTDYLLAHEADIVERANDPEGDDTFDERTIYRLYHFALWSMPVGEAMQIKTTPKSDTDDEEILADTQKNIINLNIQD